MGMREKLEELKNAALGELAKAATGEELQELKVRYLGRKGPLTEILRGMGQLPAEERPKIGEIVNQVKRTVEQTIKDRQEILQKEALKAKIESEKVDITLPGRKKAKGHLHPITLTEREIKKIFMHMGFDVVEGPEIDNDYFNFEALNLPKDHPARDMQDTFYITDNFLLRTQTSGVQARTMQSVPPNTPIRMISPGAVYRNDYDATHSPMFHQVEGLVIDKGISLADLKGTLEVFLKDLFGSDTRIRFRCSYFPFTEPSAEVDISFASRTHEDGDDPDWLEILGCGMVHHRVLELNGYDMTKVSGFAFGMGVERIAMLLYGIDDLRLFYENDMRFLKQF